MNSEEKKNYIYNLIYRLSICILPLIVTPYVARVLGAEGAGLYSFSSTIACYFIMFGKLGLDNYGNRSIALCKDNEERRSRVFWEIYLIQIVTSVLSIFAYVLFVLNAIRENTDIYWIQLLYVLSVLLDVSWFFYGMEKFRITTIRSLISRVLIIICTFLFVHTEKDLWVYTCVMSACFLLEQLQLIPFLFRYVKKVPIKKQDIRKHILPNIRLFIPLLALSLFHWMDKIMLGIILQSTAIVAFYVYAENIISLPKGILTALDTVMLPRISHMLANNRIEESIQKFRDNLKFNNFLCCALCFGIAGMVPNFIPWFLGAEYLPSIPLAIELAAVMIPMGIANVVQTQYLIPFRLEHIYVRAVILGAIINTILNLVLIPLWNASGAVIATLIAETIVCVYQLFYIRNIYHIRYLMKSLLPFVICGAMEFAATYLIGKLPLQTWAVLLVQICFGGAVYLAASSIYLIFISKEYHSFRDMIKVLKI